MILELVHLDRVVAEGALRDVLETEIVVKLELRLLDRLRTSQNFISETLRLTNCHTSALGFRSPS